MANCPKCGQKLKIWNVSQFCPSCGVNMRFHNFEENFYRDAKKAELTNAAFHVKMRHLKGALIGSKLMIARLALSLLPVLTLLIPAANFHLEMPFISKDFSVGLLGIINLVTGADLGFVFEMVNSPVAGAEFKAVSIVLIAYAAVVVFVLAVLLSSLLCFISIKNMQKVICGFAAGGMLASVATQIVAYMNVFDDKAVNVLLSGKVGFGLYVTLVAFAVVFFVNLKIHKQGVPVVYDEGMQERLAIYKKVKSGEISVEDLPQPVVETSETRAIEEDIRKEEENMQKMLGALGEEAEVK